ncbi:MAG: 6-carboxy-5,6,7,8-tetrahydropterin synthase [Syntrophorhabdus sp. PtaU1.Bin153]|nr:MAG: 6-carboxy-5,6,7,8-tetrahydropterin synthase [Syntrophorhabdus sp. PtaU1.Bin153]
MYEISIETHFSAGHHLRNYRGKCEFPHGHNWIVKVYVQCKVLDEVGIGIDFADVKTAANEIMERLDHRDLNQLPLFSQENPTSENIARYIYRALSGRLNDGTRRVSKVKVYETPGNSACYWE